MTLYVEYVLINNFMIDYLVLYMAGIIVRRRLLWWRVLLSACLGAGYAVLAPLIPFPYDVPLRFVSLVVMCVAAVGIKPKILAKYAVVFLIITLFLGGMVTAGQYLGWSIIRSMSEKNSCLSGIVALCALTILLAVKAAMRIINASKHHGELLPVTINTCGKEYIDKALYDSGNRLYYKGLYPVIVVDSEYETGNNVGSIKVKTINGVSTLEIYNIKKMIIGSTVYNNIYAIKKELENGYKVILHADYR